MRFLDVTVSEYDRAGVDKDAETIQVDKVVIHPKFVPATLLNDICLLKLKKPIEFNSECLIILSSFYKINKKIAEKI